ncbi:MAG: MarR family winged helix-turn-helix transcriptional regulator [Lawsonibacter sp.]
MKDNRTNGQLIKQIHDAIERVVNNSLRQNDLTLVQIWVLLSLSEQAEKTYSLKELERILGVAQSTCAGIVNRLALKKLVNCFPDPMDKRMKLVRITPEGEACCETARTGMAALDERIFRGMTKEEQKMLHDLLQKVYDNIHMN